MNLSLCFVSGNVVLLASGLGVVLCGPLEDNDDDRGCLLAPELLRAELGGDCRQEEGSRPVIMQSGNDLCNTFIPRAKRHGDIILQVCSI